MTIWLKRIALVLAIILLVMSFVNASWLTGPPPGRIRLIAHRGAYQLFDHTAVERDTCTAGRIEAPYHQFLENTLAGMDRAARTGAGMIELDIAATKEASWRCSTTGRLNAAPMASARSGRRPWRS